MKRTWKQAIWFATVPTTGLAWIELYAARDGAAIGMPVDPLSSLAVTWVAIFIAVAIIADRRRRRR